MGVFENTTLPALAPRPLHATADAAAQYLHDCRQPTLCRDDLMIELAQAVVRQYPATWRNELFKVHLRAKVRRAGSHKKEE